MFKPRFAIFVDGGFIQKVLERRNGALPTSKEILAECDRITTHEAVSECDILRIYYYDAPPAQETLRNPIDGSTLNLQETERCKAAMKLHADLKSAPNLALRMGEIRVGGWRVSETSIAKVAKTPRAIVAGDLRPNLRQKGVDIRIGLDIARLALNDTVRSMVVVTSDTDFVPAFKFARREGIKVFLDTLGQTVRPELIEHSDLRLSHIPTPEEVKRERQRRQRKRRKEKERKAANDTEADAVKAKPAVKRRAANNPSTDS